MAFGTALQLKVFLTFLKFQEHEFVKAFFESGTVVPVMQTLTDVFVPDEARCLSLTVLQRLAEQGRHYKDLLCSQGLILSVVDCIKDGQKWEVFKCAGRLLSELAQANPRHQRKVFEALQDLMSHSAVGAQHVGAQVLISLVAKKTQVTPSMLQESETLAMLVPKAQGLLDSRNLRVRADAYCLLCRLVKTFDCDTLLNDFAHAQLPPGWDGTEEWTRLELEARKLSECHDKKYDNAVTKVMSLGRLNNKAAATLYRRISDILARERSFPEDEDLFAMVNSRNLEFCEEFRVEAGQVLKWSLLFFLLQRNQQLCTELVDAGLTEMLLMAVLDTTFPVKQAAALAELHRLQLLSHQAKRLVETVLQLKELLHALSLDQFMEAADDDDFRAARSRLRTIRSTAHAKAANTEGLGLIDGINLCQRLMEQDVRENLGIHPRQATPQIMTSSDARTPSQEARAVAPGEWSGQDSDLVHLEGLEFHGSMTALLFDPLEPSADDASPILQELQILGGCSKRSVSTPDKAVAPLHVRHRSLAVPPKESHRSSIRHRRALALRGHKCKKSEGLRNPCSQDHAQQLGSERSESVCSSAESTSTELSVRCGVCHHGAGTAQTCSKHGHQHVSLAETSVGPDTTTTSEDVSTSEVFPLAEFNESTYQVMQRSAITTVLEAPRSSKALGAPGHKRIIHVAPAPFHDCLAFDCSEIERDRVRTSDEVVWRLHPKTRSLFSGLEEVGKFPRRCLRGSAHTNTQVPGGTSLPPVVFPEPPATAPAGPASRLAHSRFIPSTAPPHFADARSARRWRFMGTGES